MALLEPEMATAEPEMASVVTEMALEKSVMSVVSAVYWSDGLFSASNHFWLPSVPSFAKWGIGVAVAYR